MFDPTTRAIQKVGAAILNGRNILVVRKKRQESDHYIMPGGRMEEGETQRETLTRELREELGVKVRSFEYIGSYSDIAVFEGDPLIIHAYQVEIEGEITPLAELGECRWIDAHFEQNGIKVGSIMAKKVIPELVRNGKM
ncbi:NUDIX hydrolase [Micromonospora arida]|uniref:NUDIX hydrolase n=1 Tax=Micromonospora arida TaxID=2203715 RepID=UPI0033EB2835